MIANKASKTATTATTATAAIIAAMAHLVGTNVAKAPTRIKATDPETRTAIAIAVPTMPGGQIMTEGTIATPMEIDPTASVMAEVEAKTIAQSRRRMKIAIRV